VLVTATPDDADVVRFEKELGVHLNRVTIGRNEPVEEGLIKEGIKCVAYLAPPEQEAFGRLRGDGAARGRGDAPRGEGGVEEARACRSCH